MMTDAARQGKQFAEQAEAETKRFMAEMAARTADLRQSLGPPNLNEEFAKEIAEGIAQQSAGQVVSHQILDAIQRRRFRR
ncbi:MAG TPA: hypothetical protein VHY91_05460 [Pirellulales bacterium]|nr:hypothetical protein [Pirellulales bacterium]